MAHQLSGWEVPGRLSGKVGPGADLGSLDQTEFLFGLAAKRPLVQVGLVSLETEQKADGGR